MWNRQPDNRRSDPFSSKKKGVERLAAESSKCPSCGANIVYQPEVKGMMCHHCGNIFDPYTMELMGSFGAGDGHDYVGEQDISEEDKKRHEIVCNSCGASCDGSRF